MRSLRLATILLLCGAAVRAEHYRFRHFGAEDGLNTAVGQILQDRTGFLWVATADGLFRFDGAHFQRFGTEDGLPSASVRGVHESGDGTLWALTARGLARWHRMRFEAAPTGEESVTSDWRAIGSRDGTLYLGTDRGLLSAGIPSDGSMPHFLHASGSPGDPVSGILPEANGTVWFGCGLQLCLLENDRLRKYGEAEGLPPERWCAMLRDSRGDLWIRGPQHLYTQAAGANGFQARDQGLPQSSNSLMALAEDRKGTLLVSTDLGLARLEGGRWQLIGSAQGLESDTVTSVYQDREGSVWIGLWGAGIARWSGHDEWTNWTTADGLSNNLVWAVRRHPSGALWVGTDRGLVRLEPDREGARPRVWTKADGLGGDKIKAITFGPDGAVWAGCLPGGISRIDPRSGGIRTFGRAEGLADTRVIALYLDGDGRLWVSTSEGLFRSTDLGPHLRFERQSPPGSQARTMFYRFLGDRRGRIWVTSSDGLFGWDHGSWIRVGKHDGLKADAVSHAAETDDGAIWVAYREPIGMSRVSITRSGVAVRHVTKKEGLPSNYVLFLGLDSQRRLWAGTDYGVAVESSGQWVVYTHEDGLAWDDCAANSFWAEPNGTVWIGTLKGLSRFRPMQAPQLPAAPPAVITAVKFGDVSADPGAYARVLFQDHDLFVSYASLSFLSEKNVRFRYRLVGLAERWTVTALREIRYSGLPAGKFRFEVAARNAHGRWSETPAVMSFEIVPPWWQEWWFRALAAAVLAGAVTLVVRARMQKIAWEQRSLEAAVRERTGELKQQKEVVERQKGEIEELLRHSQEISRLKSEFLANMSHEIRTPMNGVIGMTQLVLNTPLDAEQQDYITTIRDSAEALLVVINDILDFSKIEAGKMELAREAFDLRKCVSDALQVFAWKAQEKGLLLVSRINEGVPRFLAGDADRLRQILLNLVGNAMKFTERGEISVEVTPVGESEEKGARTLRFSVRDTGIGIPYEKQALIFEAFAQADGSSSRRQGGTGLGLAICSKLVRLIKGRIQVESRPGLGSHFWVTLTFGVAESGPGEPDVPAAPSQAEPPRRDMLQPTGPPLTILLAEDNPVNQKLAQRVIEKLGHTVVVVENGRQAVEAARKEAFDLILMDVQMPEMDGLEATRLIRAQEGDAETSAGRDGAEAAHARIVAMTAHAMSGDREQCLRAGMDGYISKPIDLKTLVETIGGVSSRREPAGRPA